MKRARELLSATVPALEEYIGHITTPIEDKHSEHIRAILKRHGIIPFTCKGNDHWWTLILPPGTTKTSKNLEGQVPLYLIHLPNGFTFEYEPPIFNGDKTYKQLPRIFVS